MALVNQTIKVNMIPGAVAPRIRASQWDIDSRSVALELYSGQAVFSVPASAAVTCDGTRPSGGGFSVACTASGSTVELTVSDQMTAEAGDVRCQITVKDGSAVLGSANFILQVEEAALSPEGVIQTPAFGEIITEAVEDYLDEHGIPTDTTLTQAGAAADAKATGDAIAVVDRKIEEYRVATDTTLSVAGDAADAKAAGDAIAAEAAARTSALTRITGYEELAWTDGGYIDTHYATVDVTNVSTNAGWSYMVVPCVSGDRVTITGSTVNTLSRLWCFIDSAGNSLAVAAASVTANDLELTAPPNSANLVLNVNKNAAHLAYKGSFNVNADVTEIRDGLRQMTRLPLTFQTDNRGWFLDPEKGYRRNNNTSIWISDPVRVEGDVFVNGRLFVSYHPSHYFVCYDGCMGFLGCVTGIGSGTYDMVQVPLLAGTKYLVLQTGIDYVGAVELYMHCAVNASMEDEFEEIPFTYAYNGFIGGLVDSPYSFGESQNYLCTDYIPVPNEIYISGIHCRRYINNVTIHSMYAFDANKNVIGSALLSESGGSAVLASEKITFPENCAYIRFYEDARAVDSRYTTQTYADTIRIFRRKDYDRPHVFDGVIGDGVTSEIYLETFATFHKFGVIGDSLSVGYMQNPENTSQTTARSLVFCWPQVLARRYGNVALNFGRSGVTTRAWVSEYSTLLLNQDNQCQAYVLGLGANDIPSAVGSGYGTAADIDWTDYTQNADTLCGNYGKIIQMIREVAPLAPIFLFTLPRTSSNTANVNPAIREVYAAAKANIDKIYLCDLQNNYKQEYTWIEKYNVGGHYTALGYRYIASVTNRVLCDTMAANLDDFGNIGFIPYGSNDVIP